MRTFKMKKVVSMLVFAAVMFMAIPMRPGAEGPMGLTADDPVPVRTFREFHDALETESIQYISVEKDLKRVCDGTTIGEYPIAECVIQVKGKKYVDMNSYKVEFVLDTGERKNGDETFISVEAGNRLNLSGGGQVIYTNFDNMYVGPDEGYVTSPLIRVDSGAELEAANVQINNFNKGAGIIADGKVTLKDQAEVRANEGWAVYSTSDDAVIDIQDASLDVQSDKAEITDSGEGSCGALGVLSSKAQITAFNARFLAPVAFQTNEQVEQLSAPFKTVMYMGKRADNLNFWKNDLEGVYPYYVEEQWILGKPALITAMLEIIGDNPKIVNQININDIRKPLHGESPNMETYHLPLGSRFKVDYIRWVDAQGADVSTFQQGKVYKVIVSISPLQSCEIPDAETMKIPVKVNGEAAELSKEVRVPIAPIIRTEYIVTYTFPPCENPVDLNPIFQVGVDNIIEPKSGNEANDYACSPDPAENEGSYRVARIEWYSEDGTKADHFEPGRRYRVEAKIIPESGSRLAASPLLKPLINGRAAEVKTYLGEIDGVVISYLFPECETKDQVREFVKRLYKEILGRDGDSAGINAWTENLKSGKEQGAKVAQGFVESTEFKEKNMSDEEYIHIMYKTFLNREADEGGLAAWADVLESGMSRMHVFKGFVESPEFTEICESYNIVRGNVTLTAAMDQPKNELMTKFVARCYKIFLGRRGEEAGINAWVVQLASGANTAKEAAYGFVMSGEFQDLGLSNEEYVWTIYIGLLDREPDQAGLDAWVKVLEEGGSRLEIFYGFADSLEFRELAKEYGLDDKWPSTAL